MLLHPDAAHFFHVFDLTINMLVWPYAQVGPEQQRYLLGSARGRNWAGAGHHAL
jgi:hypothetical protein